MYQVQYLGNQLGFSGQLTVYICMTGNISINKQDFYKNLTGYSFMPNIYCHNLNLTQLQPELG